MTLPMRDAIMVHHSLTSDGATVSWQAIRRYHMETMGWNDIGYHAGIEVVGNRLEALIGRPEVESAAACKEALMNARALHLCFVGNFDAVEPPGAMLAFAARYVLVPWLDRLKLKPAAIVPHRQYARYKTCPGALFDMDRLRRFCQ